MFVFLYVSLFACLLFDQSKTSAAFSLILFVCLFASFICFHLCLFSWMLVCLFVCLFWDQSNTSAAFYLILFVCLFASLFVFILFVYLNACLFVCLFVCLFWDQSKTSAAFSLILFVCLFASFICFHLCLFSWMLVCLFVCLFWDQSNTSAAFYLILFVCLFASLFVFILFVYLNACLFVCLFVCLFWDQSKTSAAFSLIFVKIPLSSSPSLSLLDDFSKKEKMKNKEKKKKQNCQVRRLVQKNRFTFSLFFSSTASSISLSIREFRDPLDRRPPLNLFVICLVKMQIVFIVEPGSGTKTALKNHNSWQQSNLSLLSMASISLL